MKYRALCFEFRSKSLDFLCMPSVRYKRLKGYLVVLDLSSSQLVLFEHGRKGRTAEMRSGMIPSTSPAIVTGSIDIQ